MVLFSPLADIFWSLFCGPPDIFEAEQHQYAKGYKSGFLCLHVPVEKAMHIEVHSFLLSVYIEGIFREGYSSASMTSTAALHALASFSAKLLCSNIRRRVYDGTADGLHKSFVTYVCHRCRKPSLPQYLDNQELYAQRSLACDNRVGHRIAVNLQRGLVNWRCNKYDPDEIRRHVKNQDYLGHVLLDN